MTLYHYNLKNREASLPKTDEKDNIGDEFRQQAAQSCCTGWCSSWGYPDKDPGHARNGHGLTSHTWVSWWLALWLHGVSWAAGQSHLQGKGMVDLLMSNFEASNFKLYLRSAKLYPCLVLCSVFRDSKGYYTGKQPVSGRLLSCNKKELYSLLVVAGIPY